MPNEQRSGGGPFYDGLKILEIILDKIPQTLFIFIESAKAEQLKIKLENNSSLQKKNIKIKIIRQEEFPADIVIRLVNSLDLKIIKYPVFAAWGTIRKKGSSRQLN